MVSTDRVLLRLHVEAVWDVRFPSPVLNENDCLLHLHTLPLVNK